MDFWKLVLSGEFPEAKLDFDRFPSVYDTDITELLACISPILHRDLLKLNPMRDIDISSRLTCCEPRYVLPGTRKRTVAH